MNQNKQKNRKRRPKEQQILTLQKYHTQPLLQYKTQIKLPLQHSYQVRGYHIYPAFDDTHLLKKKGFSTEIKHFNSDGVVLKQLKIKQGNIFGNIQMFVDREAILLQYSYFKSTYFLTIWDLFQNKSMKFYFMRQFGKDSQMRVLFFQQTKLICLIQIQKQDYSQDEEKQHKNRIKIEYYQWPIKTGLDKPIHQFTTESKHITDLCQIQKLNSHSGIAWSQLKTSYDNQPQQFYLHIYDLRKQNTIQTYKFDSFKNDREELFSINVLQVWQPIWGTIYIRYNIELSQVKVRMSLNPKTSKQKIQQLLKLDRTIECVWKYRQNKCDILQFGNKSDHVLQFTNGLRTVIRYKHIRNFSMFSKKPE